MNDLNRPALYESLHHLQSMAPHRRGSRKREGTPAWPDVVKRTTAWSSKSVWRSEGFVFPKPSPDPEQSGREPMRHHHPIRDRLAVLFTFGCLTLGWSATAPRAIGQVPGPEIFHKDIKSPMELWDAADYLVRTGQAKHAVPFLNKFLESKPDDATLIAIRDRYGVRSILRLEDDPATRPLGRPIVEMLNAAVRRNATDPERIARFIDALTKTHHEQDYAIERLRESGPYAVPALIQTLQRPALGVEQRSMIVHNMGRLDRSAVPPLIASLDSGNSKLIVDLVEILGQIGDRRALTGLMYLAARNRPETQVGQAVRRAIRKLTGESYESQPRSTVRLLTDEARAYHTHAVRFPSDPALIWEWDAAANVPAPRQATQSEAEAIFGNRLAREALELDRTHVPAQVVLLSLALEKAIERSGFTAFPAKDPTGAYAMALASGPAVLGEVLSTAIADGKFDLAAAAATALGQVTDATALPDGRRLNPLIEALSVPSRRVQLAAARALVLLEPRKPFAGSSRVVPILAWFVTNQPAPRAVVIDGNVPRGSQLTGHLKALGYDPLLAPTGAEGFRLAADSADVEIILVDHHMVQGAWRLSDTLANLRADARTAGIPIYVVGPLNLNEKLNYLKTSFPGVKFLVQPTTPDILEKQLGGRPAALSAEERAGYARQAAVLLTRIANAPGSPFEPDLSGAESALTIALSIPGTSLAASATLGEVPGRAAQLGLADVVIDTSKPAQLRVSAAAQLAKSLQRFGRLVAADQEIKLLGTYDRERDPAVRTAIASVIGALRPKAGPVGHRLQQYEPLPPQPTQAPEKPESDTSPPASDSAAPAEKNSAPQEGANP